jgi:aspartyl-tRNA(Asn)/glutamyl-tRNA(Gln) amidotransferase subunit B
MSNFIDGNTGKWEYVIGLEIHAQITTKSKLFSGAATEFGADANSQVSFIDAAMPGMLPVLNEECIKQAVKTGLAINARINKTSIFDRKNYFYADLPQGYQISQFYHPIVDGGEVQITLEDGTAKTIRVNRIHVEQDAGKSFHDQSPNTSFIDLNRSGIGLMEIVSEADLRSPYEAGEYLKKLRAILRYLGTCDGDMEKGSMRCDANVSVRKAGEEYGTRCEIKNVNSIKNVMRAIEFEGMRQVDILESGGKISQETRLFDAGTGETRTMRSKEDSHDYRYFPDPDLLPLVLEDEYIEEVRGLIPELPDKKIERYQKDFGLSRYDSEVLSSEQEIADYFEEVAKNVDPKLASNWITVELFAYLNKAGISLSQSKISASKLAGLVKLIQDNVISGKIAKTVFEIMFDTGGEAAKIVEEQGLSQVSDLGAIEAIIDQVLSENADKVIEYRSGKDKLFAFFVGQVMKISQGKANPGMVNEILIKKLTTTT